MNIFSTPKFASGSDLGETLSNDAGFSELTLDDLNWIGGGEVVVNFDGPPPGP